MSLEKTVIYFYHVPKCGGSFLAAQLQRYCEHLEGHLETFVDLNSSSGFETNQDRLLSFLRAIPERREEYLFVHHHHRFGGMAALSSQLAAIKEDLRAAGHRFFMFTVLRHPVSLHVSRLNYLASTGEYEFDSIRPYLTDETTPNFMSKYLLYNHPAMWRDRQHELDLTPENLIKHLQVFDRLFVQEEMSAVTSFLEGLLGIDAAPAPGRLNVGVYKLRPTPEEEGELAQLSTLDGYLYDLIQDRGWRLG